MRLFVGIPLADAVVHEITALVRCLRAGESGQSGRRWTAPESWHITLQFLGNTTAQQFECLTARLTEVRCAAIPVELGVVGVFDRAGVLFVEVVVAPELSELQQRVTAATSRCGFVAETRPFHPHITLARKTGNKGQRDRGNRKADLPAWEVGAARGKTLSELVARAGQAPPFTRFTAREYVLYESHLGREGARYEVRERFSLHDP